MNKSYFLVLFLYNIIVIDSNYSDKGTISIEEYQYANPLPCNEFCEVNTRAKRSSTPIRSKILEVMKKTPTLHVNPPERSIFDFISDKYELPKGKFNSISY